ncbi:kinase-like domain-containing protein [Syncephalis pseudoplumigaleata]|uniref:Kinase-like domain-containing protein n=1 Tax=Syncephalis pseudoplumigaleata TaxID=1712513 RepID=A0A4P9YRQ0_9FUNG|nr:kinase-like domain-containing protein [Syncephalis pseudoplumigaleata]|eukprot:RKP22583.1 kinase-like domain-containing protein [Syncephalis pseudoplumigaleata]
MISPKLMLASALVASLAAMYAHNAFANPAGATVTSTPGIGLIRMMPFFSYKTFMGQPIEQLTNFAGSGIRIVEKLGGSSTDDIELARGVYGIDVAVFVKCVSHKPRRETRQERKQAIERETNIFDTLRPAIHKATGIKAIGKENVSKPYFWFNYAGSRCFVYSYGGNKRLTSYSKFKLPMQASTLKTIMVDALKGLMFMHNADQVHNDINPDNIMVFYPYFKRKITPSVTIVDFDSTTKVERNPDGSIARTTNKIGTPAFFPPETWKEYPADPTKKDIWALGLVLHEAITGRLLFKDMYTRESTYKRKTIDMLSNGIPSMNEYLSDLPRKQGYRCSQSLAYRLQSDMQNVKGWTD